MAVEFRNLTAKIFAVVTEEWSWLEHVLRMPEHRLVRQVLLNCVNLLTRRFSQTYQPKYRECYKKCLRIGSYGVAIGPHCVANLYKGELQ